MLEQYGITPKNLSVDKLKKQYQDLLKQKALSSTHNNVAKESKQLQQKSENICSYIDAPAMQNNKNKFFHRDR